MSKVFKKINSQIDSHTMMIASISLVMFIFMSFAFPSKFLTVGNFQSMGLQLPEFGILALGMMFAMIIGGVDLSLVGIANLSSIVAAKIILMTGGTGLGIILGIACAILVGMLCGLLNGYLVEKFTIPPMLITLATQQLFTGISIIITKGPAISGLPDAYANIANGFILGIPISLIVFIIVVAAVYFIIRHTVFGRELLFYGSNQTATKYSGINSLKVVMKTFMIGGILAAIAGILISSHYNSAKADYGVSYTLQSLLIVVLGGISPNGGKENIFGVVFSIILIQLISSAFNVIRLNAFIKSFVFGLLLLLVVLITLRNEKRKVNKNEKNNE